MKLFPAIDILGGRAVRLLYGKRELVTDYGLPLDRAKRWRDAGAEWLHVVDLDGAFDGGSRADKILSEIVALGIKVQSGGGLRTMEEIESRLETGVSRVVLGTVCHTDPALFEAAVARFGEKIVAGIDCRNGFPFRQGLDGNGKGDGRGVRETGAFARREILRFHGRFPRRSSFGRCGEGNGRIEP